MPGACPLRVRVGKRPTTSTPPRQHQALFEGAAEPAARVSLRAMQPQACPACGGGSARQPPHPASTSPGTWDRPITDPRTSASSAFHGLPGPPRRGGRSCGGAGRTIRRTSCPIRDRRRQIPVPRLSFDPLPRSHDALGQCKAALNKRTPQRAGHQDSTHNYNAVPTFVKTTVGASEPESLNAQPDGMCSHRPA